MLYLFNVFFISVRSLKGNYMNKVVQLYQFLTSHKLYSILSFEFQAEPLNLIYSAHIFGGRLKRV